MGTEETTAYIGIGSNLEDPYRNCLRAVEEIDRLSGCRLIACSKWYRTRPVGPEDQDWYVNGAASMATALKPLDLIQRLLGIETGMGRVRNKKWEPRIIDLDVLLYGDEVIDEETLKVPHPLMHHRRFVLVPMVDLAPDLIHPVLGLSMAALLRKHSEAGQDVVPYKE